MQIEVVESRNTIDEWRVEAIGHDEGECYVTLFSGPEAEARAREYASWKYAC